MTGDIRAHVHFANYKGLVKAYAEDLKSRFHPIGTDHNSIIVHELGHALDGYMTKRGLCGGRKVLSYTVRSSKKIQEQVLERLGWDMESMKKKLESKGLTDSLINDIVNPVFNICTIKKRRNPV